MLKYVIGILTLTTLGVYTLSERTISQFESREIKATIADLDNSKVLNYTSIDSSSNTNNQIVKANTNTIKKERITYKELQRRKDSYKSDKVSETNLRKTKLKSENNIPNNKQPSRKTKTIDTSDIEDLDFINNEDKVTNNIMKDTNKKIVFINIVKKINYKDEKIKAQRFEIKEDDRELFDEAYLNINGKDPISVNKINNIKEISKMNLIALVDNLKLPKEKAYIAKTKPINNNKNNRLEQNETIIKKKPTLDRISTAMSANEKSNKNGKPEMELTFYDYSNDEKSAESQNDVMKNKTESLIKESVSSQSEKKSTTERWVNPLAQVEVKKPRAKLPKLPSISDIDKLIASNNTKPNNNQGVNDNEQRDEQSKNQGFIQSQTKKNKTYQAFGTYKVTSISDKNDNKQVYDYDLVFNDDIDQRNSSNNNGEYTFKYKLNTQHATRRITVFAKNHLPTSIDVSFEAGDNSLNIPAIEREAFGRLMTTQNLRGMGAHALIELDNTTEDVELGVESIYENKLYLDYNYKAVKREESDFRYILFVGVEPGNHILSFKTFKNDVTSKIIHLVDDEVFYDLNFYREYKKDSFTLEEEHLLSAQRSMLDITKEDIVDINFDSKIKMKTLNEVEIVSSILPHSTRKYYQLKHLREPIFIGRSTEKTIIVPSEAYMREVMHSFNERLSEKDCFIQVNLSKEAKSLNINGISSNKMMRPIIRILDSDGVFYETLSNESKRIFILGKEQGMVSAKVEYTNGSLDFIQSYCAEKSYLIEQL